MSNDLITPDNLSKELLQSIYDDAYMNVSFDNDGDLKVSDGGINCLVLPSDRSDRIRDHPQNKHADEIIQPKCVCQLNLAIPELV